VLPLLLPPLLLLLLLLLLLVVFFSAGLVSLNLSLEPNLMPVELRALDTCSSRNMKLSQWQPGFQTWHAMMQYGQY
jgi:hypothetical protein